MSQLILNSTTARRWFATLVMLSLLAGCGGVTSQPTASPVTTVPPTIQAPPAPGAALLTRQGFGQQDRIVAIGFVVKNPHTEALSAIPYSAQALDAAGLVLQTTSGQIDLLLVNQEAAFGAEVAVPQMAKVARVEVKLEPGTPIKLTQPLELLAVNTPGYGVNPEVPGGQPLAVGVVTNPSQQPLEDVLVTTLLLDNDDQIIGAGSAMIDRIEASKQAGFQAQVINSAEYTNLAMSVAYTKGSLGLGSALPSPPSPPPGEKITELEGQHVPFSERVKYNSNPPTSGPHWEAWAAWGIFVGTPPFDEQLVHNLEHGGVIISYNPAKISDQEFAEIFALYREFKQLNYRFILTERKDLPSKLAMSAWGYLQTFDQVDPQAMTAFANAQIAQGPECSGGECAP